MKSVLVLGSLGWAVAAHATKLQVLEDWVEVGRAGNKAIVSWLDFSLTDLKHLLADWGPDNDGWSSAS